MTWWTLVHILGWCGMASLALYVLLIFGESVCYLAEWKSRKRERALFNLRVLMYRLGIRDRI